MTLTLTLDEAALEIFVIEITSFYFHLIVKVREFPQSVRRTLKSVKPNISFGQAEYL